VALTTELAGRTSAYLVAEVRPQVGASSRSGCSAKGRGQAGSPLYRIDPASYEAEVERAQAALAKAEANLATAKVKAVRYEELAAINFVSQDARDEGRSRAEAGRADVAAARAALQTARINRGYTTVTAPISGLIGRSALTPARWSPPTRPRPGDDPAARSDLRRRDAVERRPAAPCGASWPAAG